MVGGSTDEVAVAADTEFVVGIVRNIFDLPWAELKHHKHCTHTSGCRSASYQDLRRSRGLRPADNLIAAEQTALMCFGKTERQESPHQDQKCHLRGCTWQKSRAGCQEVGEAYSCTDGRQLDHMTLVLCWLGEEIGSSQATCPRPAIDWSRGEEVASCPDSETCSWKGAAVEAAVTWPARSCQALVAAEACYTPALQPARRPLQKHVAGPVDTWGDCPRRVCLFCYISLVGIVVAAVVAALYCRR